MKLLISTLLIAATLSGSAFAGILDGKAADPDKRARLGGYNEAVANLKSMASVQGDPCPSGTVYSAGECICVH